MSNKLTVQEYEAIGNLTALGWGIRRIARELKVSRNTVRNHIRALKGAEPGPIAAEQNSKSPTLSTPGTEAAEIQTDPLSTPGKMGRNSLCLEHGALIVAKVEANLTAQRIYQDLKLESSFNGS